jgi:dihydrofolate reductase
MINFSVIVAVSRNKYGMEGIGFKNHLPWPPNSKDMAHFVRTTKTTIDPNKKNAVIMGRKTYESIGHPLPGRHNCIVTSKKYPNIDCFRNFTDCLEFVGKNINIESVFVIGGYQLYLEAMKSKYCKNVIKTIIPGDYESDVFFPSLPKNFDLVRISGNIYYFTQYYDFNSFEEKHYLDELFLITKKIPNFSLFGRQLKHTIRCINPRDSNKQNHMYQFPMFTCRYIKPETIFQEVVNQFSNIFWRNWYGVDQVNDIVNSIIIGSTNETLLNWDPVNDRSNIHSYNFFVQDEMLSCCVNITSCDLFLEYPAYVAKTALLLIIISRLTDSIPNKMVMNIVNSRINSDDLADIYNCVEKIPFRKPILMIKKSIQTLEDITSLDAISLLNYSTS